MAQKADGRARDTKERLFSAALDLFAEKGVDAVSVRDIVKRVGISTAAFYNHFESKDALLRAVYDHYRATLIEPGSREDLDFERLLDALAPAELFARFTDRFRVALENPVLAKLGRIVSMEKDRNPVAAEISFADRQRLLRFMEELFAAMARKGVPLRGDARIVGRMLGYVQLGMAEDNMYYRYREGLEIDEIVKRQNDAMAVFLKQLTGG